MSDKPLLLLDDGSALDERMLASVVPSPGGMCHVRQSNGQSFERVHISYADFLKHYGTGFGHPSSNFPVQIVEPAASFYGNDPDKRAELTRQLTAERDAAHAALRSGRA